MDAFQDLIVNLGELSVGAFADLLSAQTGDKWVRASDREKDAQTLGEVAICFERREDEELPNAGLSLFEKSPGIMYVPNIIPLSTSQLYTSEYNQVLNDFVGRIVEPARSDGKFSFELTPDRIFLKDVVGEDVAKLLESFSRLANKSTGSSHPLDRERWFRFLLAVNGTGVELNTDLLESTLITQGWSEDGAIRLVIEYEFAQSLLDYERGK